MAVGLARTLRVGELVELIDVGLGNHDVDGREHSGLLVGSYLMVCPCLTRPGFARRFSYVERANAGLRVKMCVRNRGFSRIDL